MPVPTNTHEMARAFKPTANQLRAARTLLLAKAHEQSVRPVVEQYETEILAKLQLRVSTRFVRLGVEDSVILDPKRVCLCAEADREVFYRETWKARDAAGFIVHHPEACPLLGAEVLIVEAENALFDAWVEFPGMETFATTRPSTVHLRESAVSKILTLLAPFLGDFPNEVREVAA